MKRLPAGRRTAALVWGLLAACILVPVAIAAANPLLASRDAFWITGSLAGIVALAILLVQPLLAARLLPLPSVSAARRWHRWTGALIMAAVGLHVGALYASSPEDIADALWLVAPTPFSVYGVVGVLGLILTALLVALKSRSGLRYTSWRMLHNALALIVVMSSIAHALLIEGTMGHLSKALLCALVLSATTVVLWRLHVARTFTRQR